MSDASQPTISIIFHEKVSQYQRTKTFQKKQPLKTEIATFLRFWSLILTFSVPSVILPSLNYTNMRNEYIIKWKGLEGMKVWRKRWLR